MAKLTRAEVLDTAKEYVTKDRASDHGDMEDNFKTIAIYWSGHLNCEVLPVDVGVMMLLLKAARAKSNPRHSDNYIDAAGYAACAAELATEDKEGAT